MIKELLTVLYNADPVGFEACCKVLLVPRNRLIGKSYYLEFDGQGTWSLVCKNRCKDIGIYARRVIKKYTSVEPVELYVSRGREVIDGKLVACWRFEFSLDGVVAL